MCKSKISNTTLSELAVKHLFNFGVQHVCISPGSRNTPLTEAFIKYNKIKCYSQIDERSCSYFGLGIAKTSNNPVAILTTSGTATANLLPAIIEASLHSIQLIILTADRPLRLIYTGSPQTINQINLYGEYTKAMIDINPIKQNYDIINNNIKKTLSRAIGLKKTQYPGPVHLNFRFEEPLLDKKDKVRVIKEKIDPYIKKYKKTGLPKFNKPLIVCGSINNNKVLKNIIAFAERINAPILADVLSQLRSFKKNKKIMTYYDFYIKKLTPDLIIRFGYKPISKNIHDFLDKNKNITCLINNNKPTNDDCKKIIMADLNNLDTIKTLYKGDSQFIKKIFELESMTSDIINTYIGKYNSQAQLVRIGLNNLNKNDHIFIGSSTIIRMFDKFSGKIKHPVKLLSNHITRGIDGILSSAIGMASYNKKTNNYLFIGDISLFYDSNALHILQNEKINLIIVVINNKGGQIFSRLPYANKKIKDFDKFWITPLNTTIKNLAKLYNTGYLKSNIKGIKNNLNKVKFKKGVHIIETLIDNNSDIKFLDKLNQKLN